MSTRSLPEPPVTLKWYFGAVMKRFASLQRMILELGRETQIHGESSGCGCAAAPDSCAYDTAGTRPGTARRCEREPPFARRPVTGENIRE